MSCAGQRWEKAACSEAPDIAQRSGAWRKGEEQQGERDGPENDIHFISQVVPNVWKQDKVQVTHCDRTLLSCDAMKPVQRPSQSSPAHLKGKGDLLGTGARLFPGRRRVGVSQPVPGGLGAQPGSCSPLAPAEPPTNCPGQEPVKGQRWERSLEGTVGVRHVLVAARGWQRLCTAPQPQGWAVWCLFHDPGSGEFWGEQGPAVV